MAVCFEHPLHAEALAQLEQLFVLVRGVEQHGFTARPAAHDEHVVLVRPDHHLVDLDVGVGPVQCVGRSHRASLAADPASSVRRSGRRSNDGSLACRPCQPQTPHRVRRSIPIRSMRRWRRRSTRSTTHSTTATGSSTCARRISSARCSKSGQAMEPSPRATPVRRCHRRRTRIPCGGAAGRSLCRRCAGHHDRRCRR